MKIIKTLFMWIFAFGIVLMPSVILDSFPVEAALRTQYTYNPSADPNASAGITASYNWAGYVATEGSYTSVSGSWIVPTVSNQTTGIVSSNAEWIGIGGLTSEDLIQAGTQAIIDESGQVSYEAWIETLPKASEPIPLIVHAGDTLAVAITETAAGSNTWLISFRNLTTGKNYQTTVQYTSTNSSAEWIEEVPLAVHAAYIPLDDFGTVNFLNGSTIKNGSAISIANSGAQKITMVNSDHEIVAAVSDIQNTSLGFSVTRTPASSASAPSSPSSRMQQDTSRGHNRWRVIINQRLPEAQIQTYTEIPQEVQNLFDQMNAWQIEMMRQMQQTKQQVIQLIRVQTPSH